MKQLRFVNSSFIKFIRGDGRPNWLNVSQQTEGGREDIAAQTTTQGQIGQDRLINNEPTGETKKVCHTWHIHTHLEVKQLLLLSLRQN